MSSRRLCVDGCGACRGEVALVLQLLLRPSARSSLVFRDIRYSSLFLLGIDSKKIEQFSICKAVTTYRTKRFHVIDSRLVLRDYSVWVNDADRTEAH